MGRLLAIVSSYHQPRSARLRGSEPRPRSGYTPCSMSDAEDELASLEKEALHELEAASADPPGGLIPSFRLWHYPADGTWVTWVLFIPTEVEPWISEGIVRQVWWNRPAALARQATDPLMGTVEATVGAKDLHHLLGRAAHIKVDCSALTRGSLSITEFGLEGFINPFLESAIIDRLEWDHPVPYEVRTVMTWYSRAHAILERCAGAPPGAAF